MHSTTHPSRPRSLSLRASALHHARPGQPVIGGLATSRRGMGSDRAPSGRAGSNDEQETDRLGSGCVRKFHLLFQLLNFPAGKPWSLGANPFP
jgi:hypothetical protein